MAKNKSSKTESNSRLPQTRKRTESPKKKKVEQLDNDHSPQSSKKEKSFKTTSRPTVTKNQRKEDSSSKNVLTIKYESEVERALRLKMYKVKTKYCKELKKSSHSLSAESSSRQRMSNEKSFNATSNQKLSNGLSQSNLIDADFPMNGVKVPKPYVSINMLPSDKTGYIWKFNDGSTVKKVY